MICSAETSRRAKVQNWGSEKEVKPKERGLILPVERRLLKLLWLEEVVQGGGQRGKSKRQSLGKEKMSAG